MAFSDLLRGVGRVVKKAVSPAEQVVTRGEGEEAITVQYPGPSPVAQFGRGMRQIGAAFADPGVGPTQAELSQQFRAEDFNQMQRHNMMLNQLRQVEESRNLERERDFGRKLNRYKTLNTMLTDARERLSTAKGAIKPTDPDRETKIADLDRQYQMTYEVGQTAAQELYPDMPMLGVGELISQQEIAVANELAKVTATQGVFDMLFQEATKDMPRTKGETEFEYRERIDEAKRNYDRAAQDAVAKGMGLNPVNQKMTRYEVDAKGVTWAVTQNYNWKTGSFEDGERTPVDKLMKIKAEEAIVGVSPIGAATRPIAAVSGPTGVTTKEGVDIASKLQTMQDKVYNKADTNWRRFWGVSDKEVVMGFDRQQSVGAFHLGREIFNYKALKADSTIPRELRTQMLDNIMSNIRGLQGPITLVDGMSALWTIGTNEYLGDYMDTLINQELRKITDKKEGKATRADAIKAMERTLGHLERQLDVTNQQVKDAMPLVGVAQPAAVGVRQATPGGRPQVEPESGYTERLMQTFGDLLRR